MRKVYSFNWSEIQLFYNSGASWKDISVKFNCCYEMIRNAITLGLFKSRTPKDASRIGQAKRKNLSPSAETRDKISKGLLRAHSEGRHPGWQSVNINKENRTIAEQLFWQYIRDDVDITQKHKVVEKLPIGKYVLDFAITDIGVDIEIDGRFHIMDKYTIEKDKRRDEYLINDGWYIYRIAWKKLSENPLVVINELKAFLNDNNRPKLLKYDVEMVSRMYKTRMPVYGDRNEYNEFRKHNYIPWVSTRRVERPPYDTLLKEVNDIGYEAVGRKYGVSGVAVKKWIGYYNRENKINES